MAKQFLDEDGVRQVWSATKARFLDKTITTAQTVAGDVTHKGNLTTEKQLKGLTVIGTSGIQVGNSTITSAAGTHNFELPSAAGGTLALKGDIPEGVVTATGDNTFTGSNTFTQGVNTASAEGNTVYDDGKILITRQGKTSTINIPTPTGTNTMLTTADKGANGGVASLNGEGKVPAAQLPSYVDDVREYASKDKFPSTGEAGVIYIALDTNKTYRWGATTYVEISPSLALGETADTAYAGNKGKANADAIKELQTTKLNIGATPSVDSVRVKNKSGADTLVEYSSGATANTIVRRGSKGEVLLRQLEDGEAYLNWEAVPYNFINVNYASLVGNNNFSGDNTFAGQATFSGSIPESKNPYGNGFKATNTDTNHSTEYNDGSILNGTKKLTLPTIGGTIALLSDIPSHADYAKLSGNNTFTGTNVFNQGIFSNGDVITHLFEATDGVKKIWKVGNPNTFMSIVRDANANDEYFQFQIGNKDGDILGSLTLEGYGTSGGVKFTSPGDIYWDSLETGLFQVLNGAEKIFQISATNKEVVSNVNIDVPDQTQAGYAPSANQLVSKKYCDSAYGTEAIPEATLAKILV